jgi:hypothetical protein
MHMDPKRALRMPGWPSTRKRRRGGSVDSAWGWGWVMRKCEVSVSFASRHCSASGLQQHGTVGRGRTLSDAIGLAGTSRAGQRRAEQQAFLCRRWGGQDYYGWWWQASQANSNAAAVQHSEAGPRG